MVKKIVTLELSEDGSFMFSKSPNMTEADTIRVIVRALDNRLHNPFETENIAEAMRNDAIVQDFLEKLKFSWEIGTSPLFQRDAKTMYVQVGLRNAQRSEDIIGKTEKLLILYDSKDMPGWVYQTWKTHDHYLAWIKAQDVNTLDEHWRAVSGG